MSENITKILYTQHELLFMFQQQLRDQLNARYSFEPDFKDAKFQLESSSDWYNSQNGFDEYEMTPELHTKITLTELVNGQPTGNKLQFTINHDEDYALLAESSEITYEYQDDDEFDDEYEDDYDTDLYTYKTPDHWKTFYQAYPFTMEVSFNDGISYTIPNPFYADACYAHLATETSPVINPYYVQNFIKPYYIDYPKQLQNNLTDFKLVGITSNHVYHLYPLNKSLEYYSNITELYLTELYLTEYKNANPTVTFENKVLPNPNEPQQFSCNVSDNAGLKALNNTIVDVSKRITPAQEEIAYQITQNLKMERYPRNKMSECDMVATLPDTLQGTNTVQVSVTSEDTTKDFFVTRINDDQYRITEPFDPNNLPDSIAVYSVVTRTKDEGYSKTLGNELKRIVVNNRQPRNSIKVAKQKPKTKFQQTTLFDEPDNGPSLD